MFKFLSPLVCKVLLCIRLESLPSQGPRLPCEDEGHQQGEVTFPVIQVHGLRDFPLLSLSKVEDDLGGELLD